MSAALKQIDALNQVLNQQYTLSIPVKKLFKEASAKSIASKATTELLTNPLVMEESEVLKVQAADANELHVIASILEIQPREVTT